MSVDVRPATIAEHRTSRAIGEIAREQVVDARIRAVVPGFDAPFFQAGLAGYSDGPMRVMARRHGAPYAVTEALLDETLINGGKGRRREDPDLLAGRLGAWRRGEVGGEGIGAWDVGDHPIGGQVIGTYPEEMAKAAAILVELGYDVIDVNLACPVKKVRRRHRGGHHLADPVSAAAVLKAVREAVPRGIATTVKMRRGYDESRVMAGHFERIFDAAYELGYAWATVHCRTVEQKYEGLSRWEFLTELVKRYPDRVIFGSGDIWSAEDIFAMLEITGVGAVSVARGAIGNPWIFRQARALMTGGVVAGPTLEEQRRVLLDHFDLSMALWGERAASRMMRKSGMRYAAQHGDGEAVKGEFIKCRCAADWRGVIERHYGAG